METDSIPSAPLERLNPLNDFAFQKSMGEKGCEPQLMAFLNAVLERTGKNTITAVTIIENKDIPAEIIGGKTAKLDVLAELADGTRVDIEVQLRNEYNMEKRSVYYWAQKFTRDFKAGTDYSRLLPVIAINIINFSLFKTIEDFHTSFHIYEDRNKDVRLTDAFEIHFLEMPKFRRLRREKKANLGDPLHRWLLYFDKNSPREVIEEVLKMDAAIQEFQKKMDMIRRDPAMLRAYEGYEKALSDWTSGINGAKREGMLAGSRNKSLEIAKSLKTSGMSNPEISRHTGLSIEEIQRL
jgi:predicted transposase/invertase (TIGR01784 family)